MTTPKTVQLSIEGVEYTLRKEVPYFALRALQRHSSDITGALLAALAYTVYGCNGETWTPPKSIPKNDEELFEQGQEFLCWYEFVLGGLTVVMEHLPILMEDIMGRQKAVTDKITGAAPNPT